jgi:DNA invertase Pin-like site-specific DNA recombinase
MPLVFSAMGAIGQFEREAMLEREHERIAMVQRDGKYKGRAPTIQRRAAEIIRPKDAGVRPTEIASRLGIGRASVYRRLGGRRAAA